MIKVNELRIGNWVNWIKPELKPTYERVYVLSDSVINEDVIENYEPIPLTPEILEKVGFRKGEKWYIHQCYYKGQIDINYTSNSFYYGKKTEHGFDIIIELTSLHQLQNLIFALTGEELNINL